MKYSKINVINIIKEIKSGKYIHFREIKERFDSPQLCIIIGKLGKLNGMHLKPDSNCLEIYKSSEFITDAAL